MTPNVIKQRDEDLKNNSTISIKVQNIHESGDYGPALSKTPEIHSRRIKTEHKNMRPRKIDPKFKTKASGFMINYEEDENKSATKFKRFGMKVVKSQMR